MSCVREQKKAFFWRSLEPNPIGWCSHGIETTEVLHKTNELLGHGVTEADIGEWILKGTDPYDLGGTSKSVFKCTFIFQSRVKLAKMLVGDEAIPSGTSYKTLVEPLV